MTQITRRSFLVVAGLSSTGLLLAACGGKSNNSTMPGMNHGGSSPSIEYDQNFIDMMVTHHQAAIDMAKVAQRRGEHPEIKTLANNIISAQDGEIVRMKDWRKQWYGSDQIPVGTAGMMSGMGGMNVDLQRLENTQPFDKAFIDAMIPHHQSAISMATDARKQAKHQEIKNLAEQIITTQQQEIDQMKAWRTQWFPG